MGVGVGVGVGMGITSYARHAAWRTLHTRTRGVREMSILAYERSGVCECVSEEGCVA